MKTKPHTLLFLDPRHFHVALALGAAQAQLTQQVQVYARPGDELHNFLERVSSLNRKMPSVSRCLVEVREVQHTDRKAQGRASR